MAACPPGPLSGDMITARMEALGTSMGMVRAAALKCLAQNHKVALLRMLDTPDMAKYEQLLLDLWSYQRGIRQAAEASVLREVGV